MKVTKISSAPYLSRTLDLHPTQDAGSSPPEKNMKHLSGSEKPQPTLGKLTNRHGKFPSFLVNTIKMLHFPASDFLVDPGGPLHPRVRGVGAPTHTFPGSAKERFSGSNFIRQARTMLPWGPGPPDLGYVVS